MASGILEDIQEEVTCPICLELLTDPITLDCGHNFCQACITVNNEAMINQEGQSSCPVCRVSYDPGTLQPNRLLAILLQRFREVKLSSEEEQMPDLCARHGEKLLLFCMEDGKVICWLCERSQEHCGHQTLLLEEALKEYEEKIQETLEILREKQQEAETVESDFRGQRTLWKSQIEKERQRVQAEFKQLRDVLDSEEQRELQKLKTEEEKLAKVESELVQQSQFVRELISDLEHRLQGSAVELLQLMVILKFISFLFFYGFLSEDVTDRINRTEILTLKKPKPFSMDEMCTFLAPDLRRILQTLKELKDVQQYWVDVTLEPAIFKPNVAISPNRRQVNYKPNESSPMTLYWGSSYRNTSSEQFGTDEDFGVFGTIFKGSGRCYWEVDVSHKRAWILGVHDLGYCKKNQLISFPQAQGHSSSKKHVYSLYQPKYGYRVIGLQNKSEYITFLNSPTNDPMILKLSITVPPCHVGIFLDGEAGTLSFYNVTNQGTLIYKFSSCTFSQEVRPYLNPMSCEAPMTLC